MNLESLKAEWRRNLSIAMLALAVLMFGDAVYQTWMHFRWQTWLGQYAAAATPTTRPTTQPATQPTTQAATQPSATQPAAQPSAAQARPGRPARPEKPDKADKPVVVSAAIRKRNIFAPPTPPGQPPPLIGVIGNIAIFLVGNESVGIQEGQSDKGITVKSIKGYDVAIEFNGKPQTVKFVAGQGPSAPSAPAGPGGGPGEGRPMPPPGGGPRPGRMEGAPPGMAIEGKELPPEIRKQLEAQGR
jgi:hypothetical protein